MRVEYDDSIVAEKNPDLYDGELQDPPLVLEVDSAVVGETNVSLDDVSILARITALENLDISARLTSLEEAPVWTNEYKDWDNTSIYHTDATAKGLYMVIFRRTSDSLKAISFIYVNEDEDSIPTGASKWRGSDSVQSAFWYALYDKGDNRFQASYPIKEIWRLNGFL